MNNLSTTDLARAALGLANRAHITGQEAELTLAVKSWLMDMLKQDMPDKTEDKPE